MDDNTINQLKDALDNIENALDCVWKIRPEIPGYFQTYLENARMILDEILH